MSQRDFQSGELLDGKYRIEKRLGEGGMGAVYRAMHLGTRRTVAVKVIRPQFSKNDEFVERFRREAEAAGRLRHPNVVDVTDFGFAPVQAGTVAYLVMEYLDGCTLADVLEEEEKLPLGFVVDILEQVCSAVNDAHRLGIVHRDLKPDNIWLEPNRRGGYTVKVLDFGLVKFDAASFPNNGVPPPSPDLSALPATPSVAMGQAPAAGASAVTEPATLIQSASTEEADTLIAPDAPGPRPAPSSGEYGLTAPPAAGRQTDKARTPATDAPAALPAASAERLTRLGSIMGTPLYMSPEQCAGQPVDGRSDIYSLGVMAYRMLTGETPFTGSLNELMALHRTGTPPPIREKNRQVARRTAHLVMSALAKDPAQRPQTADGFASALRASSEGSGRLLRQAFALYSEHFPLFVKVSLLVYSPLIALLLVFYFFDSLLPAAPLSPLAAKIVLPVVVFGSMVAANIFAYFVGSAVTIPLVIQLMVAPLRPVRIRTALVALKRRWWTFMATSLVVCAMTLLGALFFVLPGVWVALAYILYAPVTVMERLGVRATLKRARQLMKRSWTTVLIIAILQFALPALVLAAAVDTSFTLKLDDHFRPTEIGFYFNMSGKSALFQLLNILVTPLTAIRTALMYLKARQSGGESLQDTVEQFDALEIPRSRWQARMRSQLLSRGASLPGRESEK